MAWLTATTFRTWYDARILSEYSVDDDAATDPVNADEDVITSHLSSAKLEIEAAARVGKRYTPPFADAEVGDLLARLQGSLAVGSMFLRRLNAVPEAVRFVVDDARRILDEIRSGGVIPGLLAESADNVEAGLIENYHLTDADRTNRGLTSESGGFWPGMV